MMFRDYLTFAAIVITIIFFKRIKAAILTMYGGSIDKMEFAGTVFLVLLVYMIYEEAHRLHEWQLFNDLYILVVAGGALTGLGLNKVLDTIRSIRTGTSETNIETTTIKTKTNDPDRSTEYAPGP